MEGWGRVGQGDSRKAGEMKEVLSAQVLGVAVPRIAKGVHF